jgi:hypothetical protein
MAASPYATAAILARPVPSYVTNEEDVERIRAYGTYEDIWNNVPEAFAALLRDGDDPLTRRYVPVVRDIIEATNRYLAQDMETVWTPLPGNTIPDDAMAEWSAFLDAFWAREEVGIKLLSAKRWMLIKADSILHISADPSKPEGSRISLTEVEPEQYFPIWDPANAERVIGCYLASVVEDDEGEEIVQRIEYRKISTQDQSTEFATPIGGVFYRRGFFEVDGWDDRDPEDELKPVDAPEWAAPADGAPDPLAGYPLPPAITAIPVYHTRNRRRGGKAGRFGVSEIQGLETVFAGIMQNVSDEDLTVAMDGLGVYSTDSGRPRDENGKVVPWVIGPASVAELEVGSSFNRVQGVGSVQPYQDHLGYLTNVARATNGAPAIASGQVSGDVAMSGIALRIHFMPVLAANAEREAEMASKWTQMLFALLTMWFPTYEGLNPLPLQPSIVFGDPLPPDRAAVIAEVMALLSPVQLVSKEWAANYLADKLGYSFPEDMLATAAAEAQATLDAEAQQIAANAGQVPDGDPEA